MPTSLSSGPLLTQRDILSLPRPSAPIVNPSGTHAVWPSSSFDFSQNKTTRQFNLVSLSSTQHDKDEAGEVIKKNLDNLECAWLDDSTIVCTTPSSVKSQGELNDEEYKVEKSQGNKENEGGVQGTKVWAFDIRSKEEYLLGHFPVPISDLSTRIVTSSSSSSPTALLAFSALVFPHSSSTIYTYPSEYSDFLKKQGGSDIRVYDKTFVRHWDTWMPTEGEKRQVFLVRLSRNPEDFKDEDSSGESEGEEEEGFEKVDEREGRWGIERERYTTTEEEGVEVKKAHRPKVLAPMKGTKLECPVGPFGSNSDFTISPLGDSLVLHSKDPNVSPSWHTRTNVYEFKLDPRSEGDKEGKVLSVGNQGASGGPCFSRDGAKVAWLEMREDGYEADRNRVMVYDFKEGKRVGLTEEWDSSPSSLSWSQDGKSLLTVTEERGHVVVYEIEVEGKGKEPKKLETGQGSVSSISPFSNGQVLVTKNSFTSPNELYILSCGGEGSTNSTSQLRPLASLTRKLLAEKSLAQGEEFLFLGSEGQEVHGWILFPPTPSKSTASSSKLPLANLCHGGPQSAWTSSWSTRWNPQSYTAKGYVTVLINRTGSTGFGQEFCDKIKEDWGGAPYRDLVAGIEYVKKVWKDKVDPERMASLGASYGGFMQNWIQGHNDAFGFKCLVCHDGVFSLAQTYYSTEELYFPTREFGGTPWENPEGYEKFSPNNFIKNWKTPQLVIHGSKDYRLVESEGLGVFNTLQRLGIPSRLLIFPSENHWVLNPHNSLHWHEEVFRFIGEFTHTEDLA
ncbi:hypothetical protein JCM16303_004137 [Sporobolomyces ruberrimus]